MKVYSIFNLNNFERVDNSIKFLSFKFNITFKSNLLRRF